MILAFLLWACGGKSYPLGERVLARADGDRDGAVSAEEYAALAFSGDPLERYDADGDGRLTAPELESLVRDVDPAELQEQRREKKRGKQRGRR